MNHSKMIAAGVLLSFGIITAGCAEHHYRAYDPYYSDYHTWGPQEDVYYRQWYTTTYHDRDYRNYRRLNKNEQGNYWKWRHEHGNDKDHHDRDHDRDHDQH
jgi:hypothetical protein